MAEPQTWWVYIIVTAGNKLYTGITTDLARRLKQHSGGKKAGGAAFFHTDQPVAIQYAQKFPDRSSATICEREIKKLSHAAKLRLIRTAPYREELLIPNGDLSN